MIKIETKVLSIITRQALLTTAIAASLSLTACGNMSQRLSNIGNPPAMTQVAHNLQQQPQPITVPMPSPQIETAAPNSLWQSSRQTFFKDQRANKVGDILTVMIDIEDEADMENSTSRTRAGSESAGLPNFLGLESQLTKVLPEALSPAELINLGSNSAMAGDGKIEREEAISMKMAAMITQVLPNGNLVIRGSQEVRVNHEKRELQIDGIIRPEDILNNNSVSYEKIAEARISYGGQGTISEVQQPRYGQQFYDIVFPF